MQTRDKIALTLIGLLVGFLVMLSAGCQIPVPANEARFGEMSFRFPKDVDIQGLEVTREGKNKFTLKATSWKSQNNPAVIQTSAEGMASMIRAGGDVAGDTAAKMVKAMK